MWRSPRRGTHLLPSPLLKLFQPIISHKLPSASSGPSSPSIGPDAWDESLMKQPASSGTSSRSIGPDAWDELVPAVSGDLVESLMIQAASSGPSSRSIGPDAWDELVAAVSGDFVDKRA